MSLKIGSLVFATDQGLGYLAKAFVDHQVVTHPLVVNYTRRGKTVQHNEWYPEALQVGSLDANNIMHLMCQEGRPDVMLFFETPFAWNLIPYCRSQGIKTALIPMYECEPVQLPYVPDLIINPSLLDQKYYPQGIHIPVPVEVPWWQRTRAEVFVHNAGWGGLKGRNGTKELLQSMYYVKSPIKLIVRSQERLDTGLIGRNGIDIEYRIGTFPAETLWDEGDVFVFPERFNGLSLPLQEARAAGMLVMCGDRFPMNQWLPNRVPLWVDEKKWAETGFEFHNPLIPVSGYRKDRIGGCNEFDDAIIEPKAIAETIDLWYGKDLTEYSLSGRTWAESMSWEVLKPRYIEALERLVSR